MRILSLLIFFISTLAYCEPQIALRVNGDAIYRDEFDRSFSAYLKDRRASDPDVRERLKKDFVEDMIERQICLQEGGRRGISAKVFAGEEEVEELMMDDPIFQTNGKFSSSKYQEFTTGVSPAVKAVRDRAEAVILSCKIRDIVPSKVKKAVMDEISEDGRDVTDEYLRRAETMRVKYLEIDPAAAANTMFVKEEDVKRFYADNPGLFRRAALRLYAVLKFNPEDYTDWSVIPEGTIYDRYNRNMANFRTERQVKARYVAFRISDYLDKVRELGFNPVRFYEDNKDKFIKPPEARIRIIIVRKPADPGRLASLEAGIRAGAPFADLARNYSDDEIYALNGGDMGVIVKGTLKEPLNSIAFGMRDGETSGLIDGGEEYYVISVSEKKPARMLDFDEVKGDIEKSFLSESAAPYALTDAKRFRVDALKYGFDKAVLMKKKNMFETDYFKASDPLPSVGVNTYFTDAALKLPVEGISDVMDYEEGFLVLQVTAAKEPEQLPLSDVADRIEADIQAEHALQAAREAAERAVALVKKGISPEAAGMQTAAAIYYVSVPATEEQSRDEGKVLTEKNGFSVIFPVKDEVIYVPEYSEVSREAAAAYALAEADKASLKRARELTASVWQTMEGVAESGPFSRDLYTIGGRYMRPFIEGCFKLKTGETRLIKSMGKYYIVRSLGASIEIAGREQENYMLKSQVLREKRSEHLKEWLKKERDRAVVEIKI